MNKKYRIEKDSMGEVNVPSDALYQAQTQRAIDNFNISEHKMGFVVEFEALAPMHLLEPKRVIADEGILGFIKILKNVLTKPQARKRVLGMRKVFKEHSNHLSAIVLVAKKRK
ncbi:hypothetical protein [Vibrio cincinnatiensis]|uniref:hypothetical protein n=1 Tax=Vibrio cincinnatiensis TaxID=675 RepID=UPI001EE06C80